MAGNVDLSRWPGRARHGLQKRNRGAELDRQFPMPRVGKGARLQLAESPDWKRRSEWDSQTCLP